MDYFKFLQDELIRKNYIDQAIASAISQAMGTLKLTAPNGDVYVMSVSNEGQLVLTKENK